MFHCIAVRLRLSPATPTALHRLGLMQLLEPTFLMEEVSFEQLFRQVFFRALPLLNCRRAMGVMSVPSWQKHSECLRQLWSAARATMHDRTKYLVSIVNVVGDAFTSRRLLRYGPQAVQTWRTVLSDDALLLARHDAHLPLRLSQAVLPDRPSLVPHFSKLAEAAGGKWALLVDAYDTHAQALLVELGAHSLRQHVKQHVSTDQEMPLEGVQHVEEAVNRALAVAHSHMIKYFQRSAIQVSDAARKRTNNWIIFFLLDLFADIKMLEIANLVSSFAVRTCRVVQVSYELELELESQDTVM